jgi:hypothetical protein
MTTTTQGLDAHVNLLVDEIARLLTVASSEASAESFGQFEQNALALANEAVRRALEEHLQARATSSPAEMRIDGVVYRRHQPGEIGYHSLCGTLRVRRFTYRRQGERNGPTIVPLDLDAKLIERATPALAFAVAQGHAKSPSRDVEQDLVAAHRRPPSRSTIDRLGRALGGGWHEAVKQIEPEARAEERLPADANGLCIGLDRTTVPMEEDVHRVQYRMAYVGTVSVVDADGEALVVRRYAAAAHEGPDDVIARMMSDVRAALAAKPQLLLAVIQDGAPELWNLIRPALRREPMITQWHEAIDRYHLEERLSQILELIERDPVKRAKRLRRWKRSLDRNDRAIYRIIRCIENAAWRRRDKPNTQLLTHLTYFGYAHMMHYASLRKLGLPVGSGVTEGACKSLVTMRAKRSGQRWRRPGIAAVLSLRASLHSDRLARLWPSFVSLSIANKLAA